MTRGSARGKEFKYDRCCVDCDDCVEDLNAMIESETQVTYRTMLRHCAGLSDWAKAHGYDQHLTLSRDWAVSFHKSTFQGQHCYFLRWSAIEYIWTPNGQGLVGDSYGTIN